MCCSLLMYYCHCFSENLGEFLEVTKVMSIAFLLSLLTSSSYQGPTFIVGPFFYKGDKNKINLQKWLTSRVVYDIVWLCSVDNNKREVMMIGKEVRAIVGSSFTSYRSVMVDRATKGKVKLTFQYVSTFGKDKRGEE
jgi:hypothetical protein